MNPEDKVLLIRNLLFFEESKNKLLINQPDKLSNSKQVVQKIRTMIEAEEIHNMLGIEVVYDYCMEKAEKEDNPKIDTYASEIKNFMF